MKTRMLFLFTCLVFCCSGLYAQDAKEIINRHLEAVGGKALIRSIKSMSVESLTTVMGNDSPTTTIILNGKGYKNISGMGDQKMIMCYTDQAGWTINPWAGGEVQDMPANQYKSGMSQIYIGGPLANNEETGGTFELLGRESVNNINAFKIKLTDKDKTETIFYFDPSTWYLIQLTLPIDMGGQQSEMKILFSDYRKTDIGYVFPFTTEMHFGEQFEMTNKVNKVSFNTPVDPAIFDKGAK